MKNKIVLITLIILALAAGFLIYRWARFSQLPDGNPNDRPVEVVE